MPVMLFLDAVAWVALIICAVTLVQMARDLRRVADAMAVPVAPVAEDPSDCSHPDSARVEFSGMGGPDEWECAVSRGGCGVRMTA